MRNSEIKFQNSAQFGGDSIAPPNPGQLAKEKLVEEQKKEAALKYYLENLKNLSRDYDLGKESILAEAEDLVEDAMAAGIKPLITLPKKYWRQVQEQGGISAKETWIPGLRVIVGTLGVSPYEVGSADEERIILRVECDPGDVKPRITGKNRSFNGVVAFKKNFIPLSQIEEVTPEEVSAVA